MGSKKRETLSDYQDDNPEFVEQLRKIQPLFAKVVSTDFVACPIIGKRWIGEHETLFRIRQLMVEKAFSKKYLQKFYQYSLINNRRTRRPRWIGLPPIWNKMLFGDQSLFNSLTCKTMYLIDVLSLYINAIRHSISLFLYNNLNTSRMNDELNNGMESCHVACSFPKNSVNESQEFLSQDCFSAWYYRRISVDNQKLVFAGNCLPAEKYDYGSMKYPFPPLKGIRERWKYVTKAAYVLATSLLLMLIGRMGTAIIAKDLVLVAYVKSIARKAIAPVYLFNNSEWIQKPLWTYYLESRGVQVTLLYYSSNSLPIVFGKQKVRDPWFGYEMMHWKHFIVWSENQKNVISKLNSMNINSTFEIEPYIPFLKENQFEKQDSACISIAVFDVKPKTPEALMGSGAFSRLYTGNNVIKFYSDIIQECMNISENIAVYVKPKRFSLEQEYSDYHEYVISLESCANVFVLPSETSARDLIEKCDATISMPFTSTSLIARHCCKPSAFYDPTALVERAGNEYDGIDHIDNSEQLRGWIRDIVLNSLLIERT